MVVKVEDEVPEIVAQDPRPLLFHARDNAYERVENTRDVLRKGWRRIVQVSVRFHVTKHGVGGRDHAGFVFLSTSPASSTAAEHSTAWHPTGPDDQRENKHTPRE